MTSPEHHDAIIIGSGQGANPLALALAKAGHDTVLIEREHIGGTCINEGCTPTKTMIASGRVAYLARRSALYCCENSGNHRERWNTFADVRRTNIYQRRLPSRRTTH